MITLTVCHECGLRMRSVQSVCTSCGSEFVENLERRSGSNRSRDSSSSRARRTRRAPQPGEPDAARRTSNPRPTVRPNPNVNPNPLPTPNPFPNPGFIPGINTSGLPLPVFRSTPSTRNRIQPQRLAEPLVMTMDPARDQSVVANVVNNVLRALSATVSANAIFDMENGGGAESMGPITLEVQMSGPGERQIRFGTDDNVLNSMDRIMQDLFHVVDQPLNGLSEQQLRSIPIVEVTETHVKDETQCSTCLDLFKLGESVAQLNCMHIFHQPCVEPWLKQQRSCPICRQRVNPQAWSSSSPVQRSAGERNISDLEDLD